MIHVDSDCGRIGELWWVNSDPTVIPLERVMGIFHLSASGIRWGTFGFGRDITINYEPISEEGSDISIHYEQING